MPDNDHLKPRDTIIAQRARPRLHLKDQNREDWRLSDAVKMATSPCASYPSRSRRLRRRDEVHHRRDDTWSAMGARVVGISCDSFAVQKAWARRRTSPTPAGRHAPAGLQGVRLYWPDLNVAWRGTVIIGKSPTAGGK